MKKFATVFFQILLIVPIFFVSSINLNAQRKGTFDFFVQYNHDSYIVRIFVPAGYNASEKWPVIVGMNSVNRPGVLMRDMLGPAAEQLNCILICPENWYESTGGVIQPSLDWLHENYNIDDNNIVLTGYSAGSVTFGYGLQHYKQFRGLIGIAPDLDPWTGWRSVINQIPIGFICGSLDTTRDEQIKSFVKEAKPLGGVLKYIKAPGVGQTGEYFQSALFTADWIDLYNFIQKAIMPPPPVTLSSPENNTVLTAPVELKWEQMNDIEYYDVQVSRNYSFTDITLFRAVLENSYTLRHLDIGTNYYWRVCAKNPGGEGKWSDIRSFSTVNTLPAEKPVMLSPDDGAEDLSQPLKIEWDTVGRATRYHLMIYEKDLPAPVVDVEDIPAPENGDIVSYEASGLTDGKGFFWKICGVNNDGEGPWTEERYFSLLPAAPVQMVDLIYPPDNAVKMTESIVFEWKLLPGADTFHFRLKKEKSGTMIVDDKNIESKGSKIFYKVKALEPNTKYMWQVQGVNISGEGPWSKEYTFTTDDFTGVEELSKEEISLYIKPNPAVEFARIEYKMNLPGKVSISMYNLMGGKVMSITEGEKTEGSHNEIINLRGLSQGIYLIRIIINKKVLIYKLVIAK